MIYAFHDATLDPARRELRRGGTPVAVEPQVFDILVLLIDARHRVVSRDELIEAIWNGRIVSEATLSSRLNAARTAVGDTGAEQRLIRTLPRKGVRFVGDVWTVAEAEPHSPGVFRPIQGRPHWPRLAVLPFANMSGDPDQDYFADGIAEEIIAALSRSSGLLVIARNSSFIYKGAVDVRQVGQELGASYVLEGSVRRDGDRLRITGLLVDAADGTHLWSDRFEGGLQDVFALQDSVAERVTAAIEPELLLAEIDRSSRSPPAEPDCYDLVLRAYALLAEFTPESMRAALECLDEGLAIDPDYAPAMAAAAYGRAQCRVQGWASRDEAEGAKALQHAWRATELMPGDAQVLWMSAFAIWNMAPDGRGRARDLFRRSLLINPNSATALTLAGWIETMCGNGQAGRKMVERARWLNPRDPRGWMSAAVLAIVALAEEDYAGAADWAERALAQNRRFAASLRVAAVSAVKLGRPAQAAEAVRDLLAVEPGLTVSGFLARIPVPVERMAAVYADGLRAAGLPG